MDKAHAQERLPKLRDEIWRLNHAYFIENRTDVSEDVRDALKQELIAIEKEFPELITPDSPTQRVGAPLDGRLPKVLHMTVKESLSDIIANREIPAEIVWEDDVFIAFLDVLPIEPGHVIVAPKRQVAALEDLSPEELATSHLSAMNSSPTAASTSNHPRHDLHGKYSCSQCELGSADQSHRDDKNLYLQLRQLPHAE
jgi:hypothetical protein